MTTNGQPPASDPAFSHEEFLRVAKLRPEDMTEIRKRRRDNNRLGFAYQLAFIRLKNLSLLEHVSPIGWDNVILYGEYVLNRSLVRP